jgi:hypothetical protein
MELKPMRRDNAPEPVAWRFRGRVIRFTLLFTFMVSFLFFVWSLLLFTGFDGLICGGLNADLGRVRRDKPVMNVLRLTNLAFSPVTVIEQPTCGCELTTDRTVTIPPFRTKTLEIPYRIGSKERGRRKRTVLLYVHRGDDLRKVTGTVTFTVAKP